ncbi:hypothetical protein [Maricaulis sp. CAU 1757]
MKPVSMLMYATASIALLSAPSLAQVDEIPVSTEATVHSEATVNDETMLDIEGEARVETQAPVADEAVTDNDLFSTVAEMWDEADLDRAPYTDDHAWIGTQIDSASGVRLGNIERVSLDAEGNVDTIVVEHGGILDLGGRETELKASEVSFVEGETSTIGVVAYSEAEFRALPDFNEDAATESPLSDDDYNDNENVEEMDDTPALPGS